MPLLLYLSAWKAYKTSDTSLNLTREVLRHLNVFPNCSSTDHLQKRLAQVKLDYVLIRIKFIVSNGVTPNNRDLNYSEAYFSLISKTQSRQPRTGMSVLLHQVPGGPGCFCPAALPCVTYSAKVTQDNE